MDPQQQQPEPTEADYALASMSEDLTVANRLKASYHGKTIVQERTIGLLTTENQELRARLESYEQAKADASAEPDPETPAEDSPKRTSRTKGSDANPTG